MKTVSGILLRAEDGAEPMPVPVTDHKSIQQYVGGWFDCVRTPYKASEFLMETDDDFIAVGYVHDEGLILDLPLNKMATMMFRQELRGDVVVVSGTSPSGDYDGDNHDVPVWFSDAVFSGSLVQAVQATTKIAGFLSQAIARAHREKLIDTEMLDALISAMESSDSLDQDSRDAVECILDMVSRYHVARENGMPQFSDSLLARIDEMVNMMDEASQWKVTDEELDKFLAENGGE